MSISKLSSDNFPISISLPPLPQLYPFESNLFFIHMINCKYLVQSCTREFLIKPFPCLNHHFILKIFAGPSFQNPTKNKQKNTSKKTEKKLYWIRCSKMCSVRRFFLLGVSSCQACLPSEASTPPLWSALFCLAVGPDSCRVFFLADFWLDFTSGRHCWKVGGQEWGKQSDFIALPWNVSPAVALTLLWFISYWKSGKWFQLPPCECGLELE